MQVELINPELEAFLNNQVAEGNFPDPLAAIQAALYQFKSDVQQELDDDTVHAIQQAEVEYSRGEGIEFKEFAKEFRHRHGMNQ